MGIIYEGYNGVCLTYRGPVESRALYKCPTCGKHVIPRKEKINYSYSVGIVGTNLTYQTKRR